jgi:hypothetical protein
MEHKPWCERWQERKRPWDPEKWCWCTAPDPRSGEDRRKENRGHDYWGLFAMMGRYPKKARLPDRRQGERRQG